MWKVVWLLLLPSVLAIGPSVFNRLRDPVTLLDSVKLLQGESDYKWAEEWLEVPIDHFSFADEREFQLRYFINLTHYTSGGPIFFYTGNEGALEAFARNTGFMWDLAVEYKAAVVFAEHRFYGKTQPFGNQSFTDVKNLGYLTSEQALADFADVITHLKTTRVPDATHSAVIVFGGSYGGMLAAWFRIKYPHLCNGAIAGSAPVFWFRHGSVAQDAYAKVTSRTFKLGGCNLKSIRASFDAMKELAKTDSGRSYLNKALKLGKSSEFEHSHDYHFYMDLFSEVMGSVVMINYPYPTNFFQNVPGWPVQEMCKKISDKIVDDPKQQVLSLYHILNIYYNYTGELNEFCLRGPECGSGDNLGAMDGWTWQVCTEMVMPICNSGPPNDVFDKTCPFITTADYEVCHKRYGKIGYKHNLYRPDWVLENYGAEFPTATNIVFSNGWYDPWSAGGWKLEPATEGSLVSIIIERGAHHYDLRGAHPDDTDEVKAAREIERQHISRWIKEAKQRPSRQFKRQQGEKPGRKVHVHHRHHHHRRSLL